MSVILHVRRRVALRRNFDPGLVRACSKTPMGWSPVAILLAFTPSLSVEERNSILSQLTEKRDRCQSPAATIIPSATDAAHGVCLSSIGPGTFDAREQSHDVESREGREHRHGIGLYSQSRIHDSTRRPITFADDNFRGPENCRTMRVLDARDHRQGDGDQGSRLTALSRRCVPETAPTSLLSGMSAAERGADQHGKGAAYLIKPLVCTPRRGARVVVSNAGRVPPVLRPRHCGGRDGPYIRP